MSKRELYPHQMSALSGLRDSIANRKKRRPVLQLPTGGGKTVIASTMVRGALVKGNSVIITVPSKQLIDQTVEMLRSEGISTVGVMQADHYLTNAIMPVQVATIQTLARRKIPKAQLVLVDECHIQFKFLNEWMAHPEWQHVPFIGLSATPWSKGLGKHFDDLVVASTTQGLIDTGFLAPFKAFAPSSGLRPDLSSVKDVAGDYHEGQLSTEMRKAPLVADAVDTWLNNARGRPTMVFAVDRAHADALFERYSAAGVFTAYIDGNTPLKEREQIRKSMQSGEIEVVVNIGCLTTGCDWPFVSCIQLCRPTKSEMLYTQIIGRGLRVSKDTGKTECMILDHTTTTERLGLVTDIHHDILDDGKHATSGKAKKPEEALPKECTKCHYLKPPRTPVCPNCGHEAKVQSKVQTVDGTLSEVKGSKKLKHTMADKQVWWSGFLHYAASHNKTQKWCLAQYKQKFEVWPKGLRDIAVEPSAEVTGWIRSRNIAWSKRRNDQPASGGPRP